MLKCRLLVGLLVATAASLSGCAASNALLEAEESRTNTQTVLAFEETVFNKHRVREGFTRYVGSGFVQHDPQFEDGREGTIKVLSDLLTNVYPNSRVVIKRTVSQRNLVAVQLLWDQKPGESRGVAVVDIFRLDNGKILEHWQVAQPVPEAAANDNTMF